MSDELDVIGDELYPRAPVFVICKPNNIPVWAPDIAPGRMTILLFTETIFAERMIEDFHPNGEVVRFGDATELDTLLSRCELEGVTHVAFDYDQKTKTPFQALPLADYKRSNATQLERDSGSQ